MGPADWDEKYLATDRLWSVGPNVYVADRLARVPPGDGLDLASGEGRNAVWLASNGWHMTAVDFSPVAVDRGRSQSDSIDFQLADVRFWEPPTDYDLIVVAYLHLESSELESLLTKAAGWLRPDGELFMIGHDRSNIEHGHGGPQVPEILWDLDQMVSWFDGLLLVESQVVRRPVADGGETVFARDTLVRARRVV